MPKFKVTAPDGRTFDVNAPEGSTQADAIAYVKRTKYTPAEPVAEQPAQPEDTRSVLQRMKDAISSEFSPESLKRGAGLAGRTIAEGVSDLALLPADLATTVHNAGNRLGAKIGLPGFKPYTVTLDDGTKRTIDPAAEGLPTASAQRDAAFDEIGLPQPQEGVEQFVNAASRGAIGAATGTGVATQIAKVAQPLTTTKRVAQIVADAPGLAAVSGGTGAASADVARQAGAPPAVQLAAGLLGGVAPSARQLTAAAIRNSPAAATRATERAAETATRDEAVRILLKNDIPLSAEQRGGAKVIGSLSRGADAVVGKSGLPAKQQRAFTRAALKTVDVEADAATPEVMRDLQLRLGMEFDDLSTTVPTKLDDSLQASLKEIGEEAAGELDEQSLAPILKQIQNITAKGSSGAIDGRAAQNARTSLGRLQGSQNSSLKYYAGRIREELDDALERSASPKDAARVKKVRDQYRAMKQIEDTVAGNPEGQVSAAKLFNVLSTKRNRAQTIYGRGEQSLVDLARAGKRILKDPVGDSGTASRLGPVGVVLGTIAAPAIGTKVIATTLAGRAANEWQPLARRIGGEGVRKPAAPSQTVSEAATQAKGALPPATLTAFAEDRRRKRKLRAAAIRKSVPFR